MQIESSTGGARLKASNVQLPALFKSRMQSPPLDPETVNPITLDPRV